MRFFAPAPAAVHPLLAVLFVMLASGTFERSLLIMQVAVFFIQSIA